ncbi:MAG: ribonuclease III [Leptospirillia bacterium]
MPAKADPAALEAVLGYRFSNRALLETALVHRSAPNERRRRYPESNERLEFLGDGVLDLVIAHALFLRFPDAPEGELTRFKAALVSESGLAERALEMDLGNYLILGRGEEDTGGREKPSLLSDTFEAILGAVYLDGGMEAVEQVILERFSGPIANVREQSAPRGDYKTALQEWTQAHGMGLPAYETLSTDGPDHNLTYRVAVHLGDERMGEGIGHSKREAERSAAEAALARLSGKAGNGS